MKQIKTKKQLLKKMFLSLGIFIFFFALTAALKSKAGAGDNATGWIWANSDNGAGVNNAVGWISLNNTNPGAGGAFSYGVNIPLSDGGVTGYAWSEKMGAIDFNPQNHCGTDYQAASCVAPDGSGNGGVSRSGNSLTGWARFVEIAKATKIGNAGGWSGWIKFSGPNYAVTIDPSTGKLNGDAWSPDELGAISFHGNATDVAHTEYGAQLPTPPSITINANPSTINLDNASLPQNIALSWSTKDATSCTKSGGWSGVVNSPVNNNVYTDNVNQNSPTVTYTLTCTGPGGTATKQVTVTTGCNKKVCSNELCGPSFMVTGTTDNSTCTAQSTCSSDSDCKPRKASGWTEVAP